jgi:PAS domain S-box-containing protein
LQSGIIEQRQNDEVNLPGSAGVRWLAALTALVVLVSAAGFLWVEREKELATAAEQGTYRAQLLADHVHGALAMAEVAITLLEANLNALAPGTGLEEGIQRSMADLRLLLTSLPLPLSVQALGADGHVIGPNLLPGGLAPPTLVLPESMRWRAAPTFGAPGQRVVPMVRRATAGRHGVAAWLVAFDHAALIREFNESLHREGSGAALFRVEPDGSLVVLARAPHNEAELGQRVRGPMAVALSTAPKGSFVAQTQIDQVVRVVAYQLLDGDAAELAVGYGVATEAVLAPWRSALPWAASTVLLLLGTLAFGTRRLDRALRAQSQQQLALRQSESHFRALADNLPDVVVRMDREGRHLYANPAVQQATGLPPEAFIGMTNADLGMPAENVAQWMAALRRVFEQGRSERLEFSYPGPRGVRHWESAITPEQVDEGSPPTVLVISRDITERRRADEALQASETHHRELFESNPHPMWVFDLETLAFLAVNDAAVRQYGYSRDEFLRMSIKDIRPPEDVPRLLANIAAVSGGIDEAGTWRHQTKDGRLIEVEITSHTLQFSGQAAELVLAHDVTRRNAAERALRESEERLRLALRAANQGLYDLDLRSGEAVVSPEYALMLGYDPADFLETNAAWRERLHPDDRTHVEQAYLDYVAGRRPDYRVEFRQRLRDGGWKWILSVGRIQERDADGTPLRMLGTHTDLDAIKAAQAARDAALQRFEKLFEVAPEAISVAELHSGRFLQVNDAFCQLFGHTREQAVGRTSIELGLWADASRREAYLEQLNTSGGVRGFEVVGRRGDGTPIDLLFSAERIEFDGRAALLAMFRDITERKRLETALQASEARLAHLLARAPAVIYTARAGGDFAATYYSPNLPGLLGWPPQRFLEEPTLWLDHLHPDDRPGVLQALEGLATQDELTLEYRFRHADGRWVWMRDQINVQRGAQGAPVELVGAWIDITARREAEDEVRRLAGELEQRVAERTEELARSEARYRTIFETVPVSIGEEDWSGVQRLLRELRAEGVTDAPGYFATRPDFVLQCLRAVKVQRLNRQALALHDARDKPASVTGLESFYPRPDDLQQFVGELEALWAGERLFTAKRSLPSVTGRPLRLMLTMSLPGLDDDDATALVCLVDITEIDRLNAELDRSVARLREANRELETFTYSVSHDLKAPLRGIDGYSRLLLTDHREQLDDEGRDFLEHIRQATRHMGALIDDLLSYSRLERRELTLARQPLATAVEVVLSGYRNEFATVGAELEVRIDPGLGVWADAQGLTLALRNLVDNAIKFSRASVPPRIAIEAARRNGGVELSVSDNGVGFDMKFQDRIFSIFQRLHRSEDYPGTGIGLAIVSKAMERMGGHVRGHGRPGEGATFTLHLPEANPT